jgi:Uma2 family endonuclease
MRAVMLDVPPSLLDERRRFGQDRFDELWNGVLHMVPPPSFLHQTIGTELANFLGPRLAARGIRVLIGTGVFRPGSRGRDYRVPDLVFFPADRPDLVTKRGIEGPALCVAEIRSPDDETYEKMPFYADLGIRELIVIEQETRAVELYRLAGATYLATSPNEAGRLHVATIDVRLATVPGPEPRLRVEHHGEGIEI